jgi:hypothetical protein
MLYEIKVVNVKSRVHTLFFNNNILEKYNPYHMFSQLVAKPSNITHARFEVSTAPI